MKRREREHRARLQRKLRSDVNKRLEQGHGTVNAHELTGGMGVLEIDEVAICDWHPDLDGNGKPEQVHIVFSPADSITMSIRLKSAQAVDAFIAALTRHRDSVWGGGPS